MRIPRPSLQALLPLCLALAVTASSAQEQAGCLDCHEDQADSHVRSIQGTAHGALEGGGAAACTTCHGPSEAHDRRGKKAAPDISFGPSWTSDLESRNNSCQTCHEKAEQLLWTGSEHQQENLACTDCHSSHQPRDPALDPQAAQESCLTCHTDVRAQMHLPSHHPIAEQKTACTDCHNPHGSLGEAALHQVTLNDNCFSCHAEKRGPHLWEHPPVAEDCSLCHQPHGSVNERLLTARSPALCQQCHATAFHPSVAYGSEGLGSVGANQNLAGKSCLNCHSQVHGSNHPSGARLTR